MNTACYLLLSLFSIFHIDEIAGLRVKNCLE
jgi:hypothetical protein